MLIEDVYALFMIANFEELHLDISKLLKRVF